MVKSKIPDANDGAVEQVECVLYVGEDAVSENLKHHFDAKDDGEKDVAVFDDQCQQWRLFDVKN